jgi:tetratricopeptide (TPR) repeat protein
MAPGPATVLAACPAQQPAISETQRDSAFTLEQEGKFAEAEAAWRRIAAAHPADAEAEAHIGLLEARQEHYTDAIAFYRRALTLNPAMPGLRLNLGLAQFKAGAMKEAATTFTELLKSEPPASPEALRVTTLTGLAHFGAGDYASAVPYLEKATAADPQNLPFRLTLAQSCLWSKQYQCVLDVYREIVTLNAESAEADMLAGEALDEMKDKAGAEEQFRAAVKADPKLPNVHFGLGYLLWGLLKYDDAMEQFKAELANNPDHAQALAYLADAEIKLTQPEGAQPLLEKAIHLDSRIEIAHIDLAILMSDAGRNADALRELKAAEKLNPNDKNVHWRLARLYQSEGKKEEAKLEFDKTKGLQKATDQSIMDKLREAQTKNRPGDDSYDTPVLK